MTLCNCKISDTPCKTAFVYDVDGNTVAEILIENVRFLKPEYKALCAGAALQKLNREIGNV